MHQFRRFQHIWRFDLNYKDSIHKTRFDFSGPCNSFYCLGHFKNVYDDDDDDLRFDFKFLRFDLKKSYIATVWWPSSQSARDNHVHACNFAKYSPI